MQIQRNSSQPLPLATPSLPNEKPGANNSPTLQSNDAPSPASGVTYTGAKDLKSMTLQDQLQYGRNLGVFTKITLHNEGGLGNQQRSGQASATADGFVSSAVSTMKDFEEGLAALKQNNPEASSKTSSFLAEKFRGLQNAAARLNVFA